MPGLIITIRHRPLFLIALNVRILQDDLVSKQILKLITPADQLGAAILYQDLGMVERGVEIGGHFKSVSAGIMENEIIAFADLIDRPVPGESVRLADIA